MESRLKDRSRLHDTLFRELALVSSEVRTLELDCEPEEFFEFAEKKITIPARNVVYRYSPSQDRPGTFMASYTEYRDAVIRLLAKYLARTDPSPDTTGSTLNVLVGSARGAYFKALI